LRRDAGIIVVVSATLDPARAVVTRPVHAFLVAATVPLFVGAALSDYAYTATYQVQWVNFSSWLIVGGLVFGGGALICGLFGLLRGNGRGGRLAISFLLLLAACVLGFINALIHARDAWASMPTGFILSLIVAVLACAATAASFSTLRSRVRP
jgi:uncharacterized membrane protein